MAIERKIKNMRLDLSRPNAKYGGSFLQGSPNIDLMLTLLDNNESLDISPSAKVTLTIIYNPRVDNGKSQRDGSFVLKPGDTGYDITVVDNKIKVPYHEEIFAFAGLNQIILLVVDGETAYTHQITYTNTLNQAYSAISIPDNLPSYKDMEKKINKLITDTAATDQKATDNTQAITTKADKNLSNVGNFATAPEGSIIIKKGGTLDQGGITVVGENINAPGKIINAKRINVDSNTVGIGLITSLHENTAFLEYHTNTLDKNYVLLDYENDPLTGTQQPIYWSRLAKDTQVIQSTKDQIMQNVKTINFAIPAFSRQVQNIYFDFLAAVSNLKIEVVINNKPLIYYPSKLAWDGKENGFPTIQTGVQKIEFRPFISNLTDYSITVNLKADGPINLKGDGTIPWYQIDFNKIVKKKVLIEGDVIINPEQMARGLEALEESKKLDYVTGLKNKPTTGDTSQLAKKDLSNVINADFKQKGVDSGLAVQTDMTNVETEIGRLKTDISTGGLGIFTFRGTGLPTIPTDKQYKAYYLHILVLKDSTGIINIPANAPDGAILSVENNDRNDFVTLSPPSGETINSSQTTYRCDYDTLNYLVKDGKNWVVAFAGIFPNNYSAMKSTIQTLFPNSLHTLAEVEAQLKDRLHTFREIQNEFAPQLNTLDAIEKSMESKGFIKEGGKLGIQGDQSVPINDDWSIVPFKANEEIIIPAQNKGNQYIVFSLPAQTASTVGEIIINSNTMEFTEHEFIDNELHYKVFISNSVVDSSTTIRFKVDYKVEIDVLHFDTVANMNKVTPSESKIAIVDNDGNGFVGYYKYNTTTSKWDDYSAQGVIMSDSNGAIPKLIKTAIFGQGFSIQQAGDQEDAALIQYSGSGNPGNGSLKFLDGETGLEFTAQKLQSLSKKIRIADMKNGVADLDADYDKTPDFIFAKLGMVEPINTDFHNQRPYFSDLYDKTGMSLGIDLNDKGFTVQEGDMLDPNVTGGQTFNIGFYFEPSGVAVASNDGYLELKLVNVTTGDYITGEDGNPIAVRKEYKAMDLIKPELLVGSLRAKGQQKIAFEIDAEFPSQIVDATENTCIYIQATDKEHGTGMGEVLFQLHTGYRITKYSRYYGLNNMNFAAAVVKSKPEEEMDSTSELMGNGLFIDTRGKIKASISNYHLNIKDNGADLPVFSIGKLYNALDTYELRSKFLNGKVVLTNKYNAFIYALMKWTGTGEATLPILTGYNNGSPVFASGWTKVSQKFIAENALEDDHTDRNAFTVPADAKQIAMIIYANESASPTTLELKDFEVDVSPEFSKTIITNTSHISEESIKFEKYAYRSIVALPSGVSGYRYTVNSTDTKLPIGVVSGGDDKIVNDNSWHDAGSLDPNKTQGDFKFLTDGEVTMSYTARCLNEQNTLNEIHFKLMKNNGDGTFADVAGSHYASTISPKTTVAKVITSKEFTFDVKKNETYRFFAKSDKNDGFFLETKSQHNLLIRFDIDFNEVEEFDQDILDRLDFLEDHANEVEFLKDGKTVTNYKISVDVDTSRISVVEKKDGE